MIHVCFALYDRTGRYSKFTGTAMLSLFDNHTPPPSQPSITVHILHDNTLSADSRDKFSYIAGRYGQRVKFYNVEKLCADKLAEIRQLVSQIVTKSRFTLAAFYRFLIPNVLPADIDRCIYLDSDIVVNLDIAELWQVKLGDKPLAAVREMEANAYNYETSDAAKKYLLNAGLVNYDEYFNAGLIVMNLNYLCQSEEFIMSGVKWRGDHPQCDCFDQDIWNYLFSKNYTCLPAKFDNFICNERSQGRTTIRPKIYHCTSPTLLLEVSDPYNRLWIRYFIQTPWFDEDTFGRLYAGFQRNYTQLSAGLKNSMIQVSAIMSGKTRAFFAASADIEKIRKIFFVRPDEEIIPAENNESVKKLLNAMKISRGQKIFFVMLPKFPFQILTAAGFVIGRDFLNGVDFLPNMKATTLDSYALIKAM